MTAVLFTCAGQRVDIVTAFARAGAVTVAVDTNPLAPALYHAGSHALVPRVDDPAYVPALAELVQAHDIRLIVPLTDLDQHLLTEHRDELAPAIPLVPDRDVVEATRDKYRAHRLFEERGIDTPPTWLPEELPAELAYPVLVKARRGFGSRHIFRAENATELRFFLARTPVDSMIQAVCHGAEFSIDVFCDLDGRCLNAIPRTMIESKGGESIKGMTVMDWDLIDHGRAVAEALPLKGPARSSASARRTGRTGSPTSTRASAAPSRSPMRPAAVTRSSRSRSPAASGPSPGSASSARGS